MSRIGKKPIVIPNGVTLNVDSGTVNVKGPKGSLSRIIRSEITLSIEDNAIHVKGLDQSKKTDALCGLTRTVVNNMVTGVSSGFQKKLTVEGVGYKVNLAGNTISLNVGFSNSVEFPLPTGVSASIEKNDIILQAVDKELLGLTAAKIREIRKPEPYKGKGIRYADEKIVRKAGKATGKK